MDKKKIVYMIKSNTMCLITDCDIKKDLDSNYHRTMLDSLIFDGEKAKQTYRKNWYMIKQYPKLIQKKKVKQINQRYEIRDKNMICEKFPEILTMEQAKDCTFNIYDYYYNLYDNEEYLEEIDNIEFQVILEVDNLKLPDDINYKAYGKVSDYKSGKLNITSDNITNSELDKILLPNVMLHTRPCMMSSENLFMILRQHVKDNIDTAIARIQSDYDSHFTVEKLVKLFEPEQLSYTNPFARTKKERNKIHYRTKEFKSYTVLDIKPSPRDQYGHVLNPIYANNYDELNMKIQQWLNDIMDQINEPVELCPHCNGVGHYKVKSVKTTIDDCINPKDIIIDCRLRPTKAVDVATTGDMSVRITHKPTGIVVESYDEKSQLKNKEKCMEMLKEKLKELI